MPNHTVSYQYKDDAGSVPISGVTYFVENEVNSLLQVPAGSDGLHFVLSFDYTKVVCYVITLGTQTAAQIAAGTFSEATAGSVTLFFNVDGAGVPEIDLQAKQPAAFGPCLTGTTNKFTAPVTGVYIDNPGSSPLVVCIKVGLNT